MEDKWGNMDKEGIIIYLLQDADEWLIRYSLCINYIFLTSNHFLIGHTMELYLKAVRMFQTGDYNVVLGHKHKIIEMLHYCIQDDPDFLSDIPSTNSEFVKKIIDDPRIIKSMSTEEFDVNKYGEYSELFKIAINFPSLKYMGLPTPTKNYKRATDFSHRVPNTDFIKIIKSIRNYLNWPRGNDPILSFIIRHSYEIPQLKRSGDEIPQATKEYLMGLYENGDAKAYCEQWFRKHAR